MAVAIVVWGQAADGQNSNLITLQNDRLQVKLADLGAALISLRAPDRLGQIANIVAGGEEFETYLKNTSYLGATVGRFANRIGFGRFQVEGKTYQVPCNNGPHHLHGGLTGFTHRRWDFTCTDDSVTFRVVSQDREDGYPGTLQAQITYQLVENTLRIDYEAITDAPTIINLTNHTYWNLSSSGSVLGHELQINADQFLEIDETVLPTGRILDVANSPYDFRDVKTIGKEIDQTPGGYDNCFAIRDWDKSLRIAAVAFDPSTGRTMSVHTTEPGVQLYTANHFDGSKSTGSSQRHEAFCLECQHFPDSPNQAHFPSTLLMPGQRYHQTTEHRFSVMTTF